MNLLSLISLWLDTIYQVTTKCAKIPKPKYFREPSAPCQVQFSTGWAAVSVSCCKPANTATGFRLVLGCCPTSCGAQGLGRFIACKILKLSCGGRHQSLEPADYLVVFWPMEFHMSSRNNAYMIYIWKGSMKHLLFFRCQWVIVVFVWQVLRAVVEAAKVSFLTYVGNINVDKISTFFLIFCGLKFDLSAHCHPFWQNHWCRHRIEVGKLKKPVMIWILYLFSSTPTSKS